jgi:hypothetical protein
MLAGVTLSVPDARPILSLTSLRAGLKRGRLVENPGLHRFQTGTGLKPEFVHQARTRALIDLERIGLALASIQGEHQLSCDPLARRMLGQKSFELADHLNVLAERQPGVGPLLDRRQT